MTFRANGPASVEGRSGNKNDVSTQPGRATGGTVLVVEDDVDSRDVLKELIEFTGFQCHAARDGAEGLALVERVNPDVALVDLGLPIVDGYEFARAVRNDDRRIYLVAMTGRSETAVRTAALCAGFDEQLTKPIESMRLMRLLASACA